MVHRVTKELNFKAEKYTPFQFAIEQLDNLNHHKATKGGGTGGDNAFYGGVSMGKADYFEYPCHAMMKDVHGGAEVVWSKWVIPKRDIYEEQSRAYFEWIISKDSPWKIAFEMGMSFSNKKHFNPEFWWDNGFIFDRLDNIPSNVLHNFLVASRMPKEWPHAICLWYNLVKGGVTPEMALVMSSNFFTDSNNTKNFMNKVNDPYDWPIDACTGNEEYIKNFLNHNQIKKVFRPPYSESHVYYPVNIVWGDALDPQKGTLRHKDKTYGRKADDYVGSNSVLMSLYKDTVGKCVKQSTFSTGYTQWSCTVEEITEMGKAEDQRLRA